MLDALPSERVIRRAIEDGGYLRGSGVRLGDAPGHKEWLHFCVSADGIELLLNFSIVDEACATLADPRETARLTCLLHAGGAWSGDMIRFSPEEVSVRRGFLSLQFGKSSVHFANGVFYVRAVLEAQGITAELLLTPLTIPTPANNIAVDDGPAMHWLAVPRLRVDGWVQTATKKYSLNGARGYHDHNWGCFRWGRNFSWQWGYALPKDDACPFSFVFLRLSDRARTCTLMQALFMWRGPRQHRVFRDAGLHVLGQGLLGQGLPARGLPVRGLPDAQPFKIPKLMGLLVPGSATDVPARLVLSGNSRGDELELVFSFEDVAQIITPNDDDLGCTVINEVRGSYQCAGRVRGETIASEGRGVVEFLSH
jgi:hypothetical protein